MIKYSTLFLFLLIPSIFLAQTYNLSGTVLDSLSGQPLIEANISLVLTKDKSVTGAASDSKGKFRIEKVRPGNYQLKVSYIGYNTKKIPVEIKNRSIDFEKIYLGHAPVNSAEVEVVDVVIPVVQNEDTTEFNADAYKVNKDASAEDLITKMAGVTVQDGKVQAQGEEVKRVLVDGRTFFGDDPNAVLKNIPAEVVEKIQVFDQQSEQAQFTGFDDGNASKTINIITRMQFREGTFGKTQAGYGNYDKYFAGGNINFFNNDQRISVLAQFNNINEQNFSSEDLAGVMSSGSSRGGFRRPGGGMGGGRPPGGGGPPSGGGGRPGGGGDVSQFLVNTKDGLTETAAFGVNYADKWSDKIELTGSYFYNKTATNSLSLLNRDYFVDNAEGQEYSENNFSNSDNLNHRFNMRLEYNIDSLNSIFLRPRLTIQQNTGSGNVFGKTVSGLTDLNSTNNIFNSDLDALDGNIELLYRRRFQDRGRTISFNFNNSFSTNDGKNDLYSENTYYSPTFSADTIDQNSGLSKSGRGLNGNITYTEPLGENSMLQFSGGYSYSKDNSDQKTFLDQMNNGVYNYLDSSLSNVYEKVYTTQNYGLGYRYQLSGSSFMAGLSYNIASLRNEQVFPYSASTQKKFFSVLPSVMLRHNFSRDENLRLYYRANNNSPDVSQLQNVLDNSNPLQLSIGNPDLSQDYRHNLNLRYSRIDPEDMSSFFVMLSTTYTNDYIGNEQIIADTGTVIYQDITLNTGTQLTKPQNLDGYVNIRSFLSYGFPSEFLGPNLNLMLNYTYAKTPGIINGTENFSYSGIYGGGLVISSNISADFDFTLGGDVTFNHVTNSVRESLNQDYYSYRSNLRFFWKFWLGFLLKTDFEYKYEGGLGEAYDPNSYLLNISFGKKLFENERGELRVSVYDVLNKNNNVRRTVNESYIEDTTTNVLGRYYMLSFIYNLRMF